MELTVKSLQGSYLVSGLESEATIADVKRLLHQQHKQQVPEPEEQCLVCALCSSEWHRGLSTHNSHCQADSITDITHSPDVL